MVEIPNFDYNENIELIGTAHFTKRSINEAYEIIRSLKPMNVALELDWGRYTHLNAACTGCPRRDSCKGICEFIGATDALGNVDANIWLIDMTEQEIRQRIRSRMGAFKNPRIGLTMHHTLGEDPVQLWELGYKEKVIDYSERQMEILRRSQPWVWRVLIDERNALMAARLAWVASKKLEKNKESKIPAFIGAAHVKGIKELLSNPLLIKKNFERLELSFTEPTLVRRVAVQGN